MAEAEFQQIVDPIVDGKTDTLAPERKAASDRIWALWHRRSRYRELELQEVQLNGNVGNDLTKEQEENLEKNGYMFARKSGIMPAPQLNGLELQLQIDNYARDLAAGATRWGHLGEIRRVHRARRFVAWHHSAYATPCARTIRTRRDDH